MGSIPSAVIRKSAINYGAASMIFPSKNVRCETDSTLRVSFEANHHPEVVKAIRA